MIVPTIRTCRPLPFTRRILRIRQVTSWVIAIKCKLPKTTPALLLLLLATAALAQQHPRDKDIPDADTRAWWHTTEALANDGMEGRDTGSPAYQRAADLVAPRLRKAGLQPAGDSSSFFQSVPLHKQL